MLAITRSTQYKLHLVCCIITVRSLFQNDEKSNLKIRENGKIRKFDFTVKSHSEIGINKKNMDFDTAVKLSGSRFVVLKDNLALLERALINFMLDVHTTKFDYTEISPPLVVNEEIMFGTGQLPKFESDQFEIKSDNPKDRKFLIPTAEDVLGSFQNNGEKRYIQYLI